MVHVRYLNDDDPAGTIPHFEMRRYDTEAFLLMAHAESGHYVWHAEIPCLVDGVRFTLKVKHDGNAFVTVGFKGLRRYAWISEQGKWTGPAEPSHLA